VDGSMNHHSACFGDKDMNGTFSRTVLPFGSNSTESDALVVVDQFLCEGSAFVNAIISMVGIHCYSHFKTVSFKFVLGVNGVGGINGDLGNHKDETKGSVDKDGSSVELILVGFASSCVE
jgi:hypothetical protein